MSLLTQTDFIGVRAALIKALGSDANRAIVLTRIYFCADERNRAAIKRDGHWWWRTTYEQLAEDTGLSLGQVRRSTSWLAENGYIDLQKHRVGGIADHTMSYRVVDSNDMSESTDDVPPATDQDVSPATDLPSIKKTKNIYIPKPKTSLPADWAPTENHKARATKLGLDLDYQAERFMVNAEANGRRYADWDKAFTNWLLSPFTTPQQTGYGAPKKPLSLKEQYGDRILPPDYRNPYLDMPNPEINE